MVWGMALPSGFGEFWPDGDFEKDPKTREDGWFDRLSAYYEEQTPEEQKRLFDYKIEPRDAARLYGFFPAAKFKSEPGALIDGVPCGPVEPHEVPQSYQTAKSHKVLGSLFKFHSKILGVDAALKDIIERLEPGVHEFHQVEMRMPRGQVYPGIYYVMRICQYFSAFSRENSWEGSVEDSDYVPGLLHLNETKKAISGLAFRKATFGKAHLWRERTFRENLVCFSDELIAEIEQAGLRIPKHYIMKEVGEVTPGAAIMQEAA